MVLYPVVIDLALERPMLAHQRPAWIEADQTISLG
jgi:hypothetical protein